MMRERKTVKQHPGEPRRRLFGDDYLELIVWSGDTGGIAAFELSYDLLGDWRAFRWERARGLTHHRVDAGEDRALKKAVPVLRRQESGDASRVAEEFRQRSRELDPGLAQFVLARLS